MQKQNENKTKDVKDKASIINRPMTIIASIILLAAVLYVIFKPSPKTETTDTEYMFKKEGELTFTDSLGNSKCKIDIELADNEFDRQLGLMFRKQMDMDKGMLFIFPVEELQSFWMRNTFISLDMIFVDANKKIVTIHPNTQTLSDQSYPSTKPALYVIEVSAGFTSKYNIHEGDKINYIVLESKQ